MNIQTVRDNLKRTIAGKEMYLDELCKTWSTTASEEMATSAIRELLKVNINELKRILEDVEKCRPDWNVHNCPYTETCHRID